MSDDAAREVDTALHFGEILPKKCRQAVTRADQCNWCGEPFGEPKRKRFVIMGEVNLERGWPWGLISICFECFKDGGDASWDSGIDVEERETRQCNGCGEPISIPVPPPERRFVGVFKWFNWGVCSMRCYLRYYRKRRRARGGSVIEWKGNERKREARCEACKKPVPRTRRGDARFCSNKCRQWTYRRRRAASADAH
jgi:hypothetical protein